jgi:Na+/H+-translocating membrane pyrophosphatase
MIAPILITGMALNVQTTLGFMGGLTISGVQLSISSSMLGILWGNAKDEIAYGRAKDEDNEDIAIDSEWGKASIVGNLVGSNLKDCSGQSAYSYIIWTIIMATVFEDLFISMHS